MKQWIVIQTHPQKEFVAGENLERQGFEIYMPVYEKIKSHARKKVACTAPLFPRYLFVYVDLTADHWQPIKSTIGVSTILTTAAHAPAVLHDQIIEDLKALSCEKGMVTLAALALFQKGDRIMILEGSFKGQIAFYEKMNGEHRAQILLHVLKQPVSMQISLDHIEKIR